MLITKYISIDMGHRVPNHKSKCSSLHGHRYKIEAGVDDKVITTKGISDEGMVIDFGDLKQLLMDKIDKVYDHGTVLYQSDPLVEAVRNDERTKLTVVDFIPTAENLCRHWYHIMEPALAERDIKLYHLKVWETPTSTAIYTLDNKLEERGSQ